MQSVILVWEMLENTLLGEMTKLEATCEVEKSVISVGKFLNLMSILWSHKGMSWSLENMQQNIRGYICIICANCPEIREEEE